jgi:hypothetical protein
MKVIGTAGGRNSSEFICVVSQQEINMLCGREMYSDSKDEVRPGMVINIAKIWKAVTSVVRLRGGIEYHSQKIAEMAKDTLTAAASISDSVVIETDEVKA